jgi:uncharacterized protein YycO
MTYTPKPGDFGLSVIDGHVGWWINLGQAIIRDSSRYTHAFVVVDDGMVIEAKPGGAEKNPVAPYVGKAIFSRLDLTEEQRSRVIEEAKKLEGTPYSFLDYLALALLHFGIRPKRLRKYIADSGHMICSQLVDEAYLRAGVHLFSDGRDPQDVTPGDLLYVLIGNE